MGSEIKIEGHLKLNPHDYDYMDALSIEGWIWEFIRRSDAYNTIYSDFKNKRVRSALILSTFKELRTQVAIKPIYLLSEKLDPRHFLKIKMAHIPENAWLPNPDIKYNEFAEVKPFIIGASSVSLYKGEIYERQTLKSKDKRVIALGRHFIPQNLCNRIINEILPPSDVRNTLYVGIATKANRESVREALASIIQLIKPVDVRILPVWKAYLFFYDLIGRLRKKYPSMNYKAFLTAFTKTYDTFDVIKDFDSEKRQLKAKVGYPEGKKMTYEDFVRIFNAKYMSQIVDKLEINNRVKIKIKDYSSHCFDERRCQRYHDNAETLINGDYKKYLYLK